MARKRTLPSLELIGLEDQEALHIPLNRTRITEVAIELLNEFGLKDLSMRKVADRLGVKPASLYYHVKDKEQLLQLLSDKISSEMALPDPSLPWKEQILRWGENFREALQAYRDGYELFNATIALGHSRLTQIEKLFAILADAGFPDNRISWMGSMLKNFVLGFVAEEARLASRSSQGAMETPEELSRRYEEFFSRLPEDEFPNMIRLAAHTTNTDWQEEFHFGLKVLIDGFVASQE